MKAEISVELNEKELKELLTEYANKRFGIKAIDVVIEVVGAKWLDFNASTTE